MPSKCIFKQNTLSFALDGLIGVALLSFENVKVSGYRGICI